MKMTDRMFRKIKMFSNGFGHIFADITFVSVYLFLLLFPVSPIYIVLGQSKQESR